MCISADQLAKDQRTAHQPDSFKSSINLVTGNNCITINKKLKENAGICGFNLPI
jgi:hypothetical protein